MNYRRSLGAASVFVAAAFVACSSGDTGTGPSGGGGDATASSSSSGHGGRGPGAGSGGRSHAGGAETGGGGDAAGTGGDSGTGGLGAGGSTASGAAGGGGANAGGGGTGGGPSDLQKRVFVSSLLYNGYFGDLATIDSTCQGLADDSHLGGTWLAWASDATTSAATRFTQATVPYVLVGGGQIATDWAALVGGPLEAPIDHDESGAAIVPSDGVNVWTGTEATGAAAGGDCTGWSTVSSSGVHGLATATDATWSNAAIQTCVNLDRVYCFEQ